MANWRTEIKELFKRATVDALGNNFGKFGSWNDQKINQETQETLPEVSVMFEYSTVGAGLEYLKARNVQQAVKTPVTVTLHILFSDYTVGYQDRAYAYAYALTCQILGLKSQYVHGRILKSGEQEDPNHAGMYDYQISFDLNVMEVVDLATAKALVDVNPTTSNDPNPDTGRRLKDSISGTFS